MTTRRPPLWLRWFFNLLQLDGLIAYFPARLIAFVSEEVKPSRTSEETEKRKLFIHAALSPLIVVLVLFIFNRVFDWEWKVLPAAVAVYLFAISFVDYRRDEKLRAIARGNPVEERALKRQLRILKIMVVVWALFLIGIQIFLPGDAHVR